VEREEGVSVMKLQQHVSGLVVPVSEKDHAQGPEDAPVTLVEYGDYECPYCGRAYPIVKRIQKEMGDKLRFVFRNFPLNTIHEYASVAALAAEAAGGQGKFWPMHDILYEHQADLGEADMGQFALRAGLEIYRFEKDMAEASYAKRVRDDFRGGIKSGVNGTPTFFINGKRYEGKLEYGELLEAVRGGMPNGG
jgi:protein-disulfide isomerase